MSLARVRRSARFVAAWLLVVSVCGLPHRSQSDDACVSVGVEAHNESDHAFTPVTPFEHEQHCAVCHWLRWMKPAFSASPVAAARQEPGTRLVVPEALSLRDPGADHLPARAPPAL